MLPRHQTANWVGPGRGRKSTRPGEGGGALSPFEFLDRVADLERPPRKHRNRYRGVFAPKHGLRSAVTRSPSGMSASGVRPRPAATPRPGTLPIGASPCRPMTIATSFRPRPTSCPRSTSTASEHCRTPGHDKAAGLGETPRHRRKSATPGAWHGFKERPAGDRNTGAKGPGGSRVASCGRQCHWPGHASGLASEISAVCNVLWRDNYPAEVAPSGTRSSRRRYLYPPARRRIPLPLRAACPSALASGAE